MWPVTISSCRGSTATSPGLSLTPATMDRSFDVKSSSVRKLCRFVLATSYNKQVPQICRWLMDHDQVNYQAH